MSFRYLRLVLRNLHFLFFNRPGAVPVTPQTEIQRTIPVIRAMTEDSRFENVFVSIDTFSAEVAEAAVSAGAHIVNDVSAGTLDSKMIPAVARLGVPYIMMHMRGDPRTMNGVEFSTYKANVAVEVADELSQRIRIAESAGIPAWRIITDPGIGFAKRFDENVSLLKGLPTFRAALGNSSTAFSHQPMLVGPSRKGFLGKITGRTRPEDRDWATCACIASCILGGANIIRAHNVAAIRDAIKVCRVLL